MSSVEAEQPSNVMGVEGLGEAADLAPQTEIVPSEVPKTQLDGRDWGQVAKALGLASNKRATAESADQYPSAVRRFLIG